MSVGPHLNSEEEGRESSNLNVLSPASANHPSDTPLEEIPSIVQKCRACALQGVMQSEAERKKVLRALLELVEKNEKELCEAIQNDFGRAPRETYMIEIMIIKNELVSMLNNLTHYMKAEKPPMVGMLHQLRACHVQRVPLGTVLIVGTWNYPLQMVLMPLIGALAAGNTAVVKPSEGAPATAALLTTLLERYLPAGVVGVVNGAVPETTALLAERFDHILYTGSSSVGRIVMTAAAKHLTPVTLELGGKSPVVVDETVSGCMETVARRVMWGKYVNCGQTCVAPDYVLVQRKVADAFVAACGTVRTSFMGAKGSGGESVLDDPHYARIVNERHFARVRALMAGGHVAVGGEVDESRLKIAPTVLDQVDLAHPLMTDEIFGPLLPVVPYDTVEDALRFINEREKPLALYVFTESSEVKQRFQYETSSGATLFNDVLLHVALTGVPFGGVGNSGMGQYHGKHSFETFSHRRTVLVDALSASNEDMKSVRYPPYGDHKRSYSRLSADKAESSCTSVFSCFHKK